MANESSLGGAQFAFDLESQTGVMQLLAAVRACEITPDQKNELRDLVLTYANGGRDQGVRIEIEKKVAAYEISPVAQPGNTTQKEELPKRNSLGSSRATPTFSVSKPVVSTQSQPAPEPTPIPVEPVLEPKSAPEPVEVPTPEPEPAPEPVKAPAPESPKVVEPVPEPTPVPVESTPEPAPEPVKAPAAAAYDPNQSLQRIREIKSLVNEKVGNPVNLVDVDNEVGREYMGALLDAMKKINSGSSALSAMERLENAFAAVEKTIEEHPTELAAQLSGEKPQAPTPAQTTAPTLAPEPVKSNLESEESDTEIQPEVPQEEVSLPTPQSEQIPTPTPVPVPEPIQPPAPAVEPEESHSEPESPSKPQSIPAPAPAPEPVPTPAPEPEPTTTETEVSKEAVDDTPTNLPGVGMPPAPVPKAVPTPAGRPAPTNKQMPVTVESAWGPATDTVLPKKTDKPLGGKVTSVADSDTKLRTPDDLPLASSLETSSVAGDPLYTKEVDNGLNQLLSEWSLFKKSGLFGTGPKGLEHPLYKKIAELQIPLLLAGRFEGATQEIKQSITDYMNGWRYEQGIIYQSGENFDHYLRRVIRHILDLQNQK